MTTAAALVHALSFDIEDWFHILGVPSLEDRSTWATRPTIVEERTDQILGICDDAGVHATFFIVGWVAERYPGLVRRIAAAGHEVGAHSFWHEIVSEETPASFREDIARNVEILRDLTGQPVEGFRASSFSITPGTEWVFEVLKEAGIRYDASLFPATRRDGGYMCEPGAHLIRNEDGAVVMPELPMSTMRIGPTRLCYSGGGYFRLMPLWLIRRGFVQAGRQGLPTVVYLHPRDFAVDCPRAPMPLSHRFRCYVNIGTTERKLRALLREYRFGTCCALLAGHAGGQLAPLLRPEHS